MNLFLFKKNRLTLTFLFALLFFSNLSLAQTNDTYKLLWKIEGNGTTSPSYLFGTMHVDDARAFNFSDAVMPSIKSCEKFALEINADSAFVAFQNKIVTKDPVVELKSVLNDEEYKKLLDRFIEVNGFSFVDTEIKDINSILALLYKMPEKTDDKSTFVDLHLFGQAKTMGKTIIGLETIDSQINRYENLKPEKRKAYIMSNLDYTKTDSDYLLEELTKIYYTGDILEIERIINDYGQDEDEEMIARNKVMCSSIVNTLQTSTLFSAVGTAHLPGKYGLINLLRKKGYTVTPVEAEFTGVAETYKIDLSNIEWQTFKEEQLGYSVELPELPNHTEAIKGSTIYTYNSMIDGSAYMVFGLDLRHVENNFSFRDLADGYINNLTKSNDSEVVRDIEETVDGIQYIENTINMADGTVLQAKLALKDKIVYFVSTQSQKDLSIENSTNRFFNSLKFFPPEKEIEIINTETQWETYVYEEGAFSIDLPGKAKDISREIPNPIEPEGENYYFNMFSHVDTKNNNNYLFRYNDVPSGYFMEDPDGAFAAMQENMTTNGTLVSDPKEISLDGYEGREYEVLLKDKYHTICRVYFKGNRTYLLLEQKLNETDKVNSDNPFFNNFKFTNYHSKSITTRAIEDTSIQIKEFDKSMVDIDTLNFDTSYLKNTYTFYTTNSNSGDVYQFSYGDFQDYFKVTDLNEFYDLNIDYLKNWNDTIISRKEIKINNTHGIEAIIQNTSNKLESRHRVWIENNMFLLYTAHTSKEDYSNAMTDTIFNGYKMNTVKKDFDMYSSKTDLIFKDLKAKDSLIRLRAKGAFDYYEFDITDLDILHENLKTDYGSDSLNLEIRLKIITEFYELNTSETLTHLEDLYKESSSSDILKAELLTTIQNLNTDASFDSFLNLLFNDSPKELNNNLWTIFQPFRDSLSLTFSNYDKLISLINKDVYRQSVLSLSNDILTENKDSLNIIKKNFDALLKYSNEDLDNYLIAVKDTLNYDYTYNGRIYQYLRLMEQPTVNTDAVDKFTSQLITREDNTWFQQNAAVARIIHKLPIEKKQIKSLLDSTTSRFEIMKALYEVGDSKKIPKAYLTKESFAKLSLIKYLEENDDYYGIGVTILKNFEQDEKIYLGAKITYSYDDDEEHYFALIGPVYDISSKSELNLYDVKLDWSEYEEDWSSLAKTLLLETEIQE